MPHPPLANRPVVHCIKVGELNTRTIQWLPEAERAGDDLQSLPTREAPGPNLDDCAAPGAKPRLDVLHIKL